MDFNGTFEVSSPKEKVFAYVMDPNKISGCIPGLKEIEVKNSDDYTVLVRAGISFIKTDFKLHFTIIEKQEPTHAKLQASGTGSGGSLDLVTVMDLSDGEGGKTVMKWSANANVGGKLAGLGQRLMKGQAEKMITQMFDCLKSKL